MPDTVTVDAKGRPLPPVDPNVKLPGAVARAAAAAEAFYRPQEPTPPDGGNPPAPAAATPEPPAAPVTVAVTPPTPPAPAPEAPAVPPAPAASEDDNGQTWKQRYHSMEGRFKQAMTTINGMQTQMRDMGDELLRMQEFVKNSAGVTVTPQGQPTPKLVTDRDRETYGDELLDTVQRAALEAVQPKLTALEQENQNLKRTVAQTRQGDLYRTLDQQVPNWRAINKSDRFKAWLSLTDLLSGSVRGRLLDAAFKAADAPRVVAFFQGFVNDEAATGSTEFAPRADAQPPAPAPAPRQPALALEALAAPGRAKPAAADTGKPADKPVFTRAQIRQFYDDVRRMVYAGRDQEKAALEAAIFAAQREGRVRN